MTRQYLQAAQTILDTGTRKPNRTGVDTISAFALPMRFDLREGFPLLTTKKISWWHIVAENLWFLSGEKHIGFLKKAKVGIWDKWADEDGFVPSAYGNFWRHFPVHELRTIDKAVTPPESELLVELPAPAYNDQIAWALGELRKNPMSRRLVVSAWAPGNAQTSALPPCHTMWALNTQNLPWLEPEATFRKDAGKPVDDLPHLCLHLTQRSCDMFLGVPYNIAGYAFILSVMAHLAGMKPGIFSHMLIDAHFYTCKPDGSMAAGGTHGEDDDALLDHLPMIGEQLQRGPRRLPRLTISDSIRELDDLKALLEAPKDEILDVFKLEGYDPHPPIKGAVAV